MNYDEFIKDIETVHYALAHFLESEEIKPFKDTVILGAVMREALCCCRRLKITFDEANQMLEFFLRDYETILQEKKHD